MVTRPLLLLPSQSMISERESSTSLTRRHTHSIHVVNQKYRKLFRQVEVN